MIRIISVMITSLLFIQGCDRSPDSPVAETKKDVVGQETEMPVEMPGDFNFSVSFGYGEVPKNEINTYENTVTKDLIMKGTAAANVSFNNEEMENIYEKMRDINILELKQLSPSKQGCSRTPSNTDSWKITIDGQTKTFSWTDQNCDVTEDANQLLELRKYIQHIVAGKDAYQALPPAEGGYD